MTTKQDHGEGAYIDFRNMAKQETETGPIISHEPKPGSGKTVQIAWILVVSLIFSLLVITVQSRNLNQANQTIEQLRKDLNQANQTIEKLKANH